MSRNQEQIDLIVRWTFKGLIAIAGFLCSMFIYDIKAGVTSLNEGQEALKVNAAIMETKITTMQRSIDRLEEPKFEATKANR